jgi:hypothetical protein
MHYITVRSSFAGIHSWPDAPEPVAFLRNPHRHRFGVESVISVGHGDRATEFFMARAHIDRFIASIPLYHQEIPGLHMLGHKSCEMVAEEIYRHLNTNCGLVTSRVTVDEDGENAGTFV